MTTCLGKRFSSDLLGDSFVNVYQYLHSSSSFGFWGGLVGCLILGLTTL